MHVLSCMHSAQHLPYVRPDARDLARFHGQHLRTSAWRSDSLLAAGGSPEISFQALPCMCCSQLEGAQVSSLLNAGTTGCAFEFVTGNILVLALLGNRAWSAPVDSGAVDLLPGGTEIYGTVLS